VTYQALGQLNRDDEKPLLQAKAAEAAPYGWILSPSIDLMFCCGGALWLVYFVAVVGQHLKLTAFTDNTIYWTWIVALYLFGNTHSIATLARVYDSKYKNQTLIRLTTISGLIAISLGVWGLTNGSVLIFFTKFLQAWYYQHFYAQLYGVALIYCIKRRYFLNQWEKKILSWMLQAASWFVILRIFTYPEFGVMSLFGNVVPFWGPLPTWMLCTCQLALQALTLAFVGVVVRKYLVEKKVFPLPALLTTLTGVVLFVLLQKQFEGAMGAFPILIGFIFHNAQYLAITASYYLKERGAPTSDLLKALWGRHGRYYLAMVMAWGFLLSIMIPETMSWFGTPLAIASLTTWMVLNVHHYFIDGYIWRLRDPVVQKMLIS